MADTPPITLNMAGAPALPPITLNMADASAPPPITLNIYDCRTSTLTELEHDSFNVLKNKTFIL